MLSKRIIPCLLLDGEKLVHIESFNKDKTKYVGDPINTLNVFNDYEVDELAIIDIKATKNGIINFNILKNLSDEAFFPLSYGGGIKNENDALKLINIGFEKIIINSAFFNNPEIIKSCVKKIGTQSIIVSLDIISDEKKFYLYDHITKKRINKNLDEVLNHLNLLGIGELLITSVNHDGMMEGCNYELMEFISKKTKFPIIYKGGSSSYEDIKKSLSRNISAIASSSIFIMKKKNGGIVLNYPSSSFKKTIC